jgi:uncharacterized membrane protein
MRNERQWGREKGGKWIYVCDGFLGDPAVARLDVKNEYIYKISVIITVVVIVVVVVVGVSSSNGSIGT